MTSNGDDNDAWLEVDHNLRAQVVIVIALLAFGGTVAFHYFDDYLRSIVTESETDPQSAGERLAALGTLTAFSGGAIFAALGVYLGIQARQVMRSGQFPPTGTRVIKRTRIRSGPAAHRLATALFAMSLLSMVLATVGMWYFHTVVVYLAIG